MIRIILILLFAMPAFADLEPGDYTRTLDSRSYRFHVPEAEGAMPLVVDLHGGGGNGERHSGNSGYLELSDMKGFVVAHPDGLDGKWSFGDLSQSTQDDVAFIKAMIDEIAGEVEIDPARLYATGLSAGGTMVHRLGCEASGYFAAIAPVAGVLPRGNCSPAHRMPVHLTLGRSDMIIKYPMASQSVGRWRGINGCLESEPDATVHHGPATECEHYRTCSRDAEVVLCTVESTTRNGHGLYQNIDNFDIALAGWEHFQKFQHPSPPVLVSDTPAAPWIGTGIAFFAALLFGGWKWRRR